MILCIFYNYLIRQHIRSLGAERLSSWMDASSRPQLLNMLNKQVLLGDPLSTSAVPYRSVTALGCVLLMPSLNRAFPVTALTGKTVQLQLLIR